MNELKIAEALEEARTITRIWNRPKMETQQAYFGEWRRLMKMGDPIEMLSVPLTKRSYYCRRAAVNFVHLHLLAGVAERLERAAACGDAGEADRRLVQITWFLERLKTLNPDFTRSRVLDPKARRGCGTAAIRQDLLSTRRSKRASLTGLPGDWVEQIWKRSTGSRYQDALAIVIATGCRPAELVNGVRIHLSSNGEMCFDIKGAKLTDRTGVPVRRVIYLWRGVPWLEYWLDRLGKRTEIVLRLSNREKKYFSDIVRGWSRRLWPTHSEAISPYSFRHNFSAILKKDWGGDSGAIAVALGHRSSKSQRSYGCARQAKGAICVPIRVEILRIAKESTPSPGL